ncbi:spermine/spermidine synthase domain-containing protein [Thermobifida cellulosilytica]|uniref:Spermidine synthase n=1 Tax=Thermobifida cellulosilytica TB100 TaxID=665004 RepID=A0A147KLV7_THECS|nr:spermidine synthase [Thermobifida cellulosilytica]KUP98315.1 spermidine synthase [Thermobifida cellulosilytica TB100]
MPFRTDPAEPVVVDRAPGASGGELVLRRVGADYEIISNGVFLMDTRDGRSERELVRACLRVLPADRTGLRVLVGGLGVGFSAAEALACPRVALVRVVEVEPQVVAWHAGPLGEVAGRPLDDPRCRVVCADLVEWLADADERFDAVCLDIDNGPDWTVAEGNRRLYGPSGLDRLARVTAPGGAVAFWSAMPAPDFAALLGRRFGGVEEIRVPVRRGDPDVVYLVRPGAAGLSR